MLVRLAFLQNKPTAAICPYLRMTRSKNEAHAASPHLCGISVWEAGAVIVPVLKETNISMAVQRFAIVFLATELIRLCVCVLSRCDDVPRTDSCPYRCETVVCLDVMDEHFAPVSLLYSHLWEEKKTPNPARRALIKCAQMSKQTLSRCVAQPFCSDNIAPALSAWHSLHDNVHQVPVWLCDFFIFFLREAACLAILLHAGTTITVGAELTD